MLAGGRAGEELARPQALPGHLWAAGQFTSASRPPNAANNQASADRAPRRAGPVRTLLGGENSPADFVLSALLRRWGLIRRCVGLRQTPQPDGVLGITGQGLAAVRRKCHAQDSADVPLKVVQFAAVGQVPQADHFVARARRKRSAAIRRQRGEIGSAVVLHGSELFTAFGIPLPQRAIQRGGQEGPAVRKKATAVTSLSWPSKERTCFAVFASHR